MQDDDKLNFFHTAIKCAFPNATNIRKPESCQANKPVFLADTRKRGPIVCKFVDARIAARDKQISAKLTERGLPVPKISTNGYIAQWYEVYRYNPNRTMKEFIAEGLDDDKIFQTYKQVLDFQAKLADSCLDDIYMSVGKYFSEVYKMTAKIGQSKALTNIYSKLFKFLSQCHNVHLVHCDLHPLNILCKPDGSLDQIIDISGIALASEEFAMISLLDSFPLPDMYDELMDYYDNITHRELDRKFIRLGLRLRKLQKKLRNYKNEILAKTK